MVCKLRAWTHLLQCMRRWSSCTRWRCWMSRARQTGRLPHTRCPSCALRVGSSAGRRAARLGRSCIGAGSVRGSHVLHCSKTWLERSHRTGWPKCARQRSGVATYDGIARVYMYGDCLLLEEVERSASRVWQRRDGHLLPLQEIACRDEPFWAHLQALGVRGCPITSPYPQP